MAKKTNQKSREWRQINYSLFELLKIVSDAGGVKRTITEDKEKKEIAKEFSSEWTYYGHGAIDDYGEAVEFKNGAFLLVVTTSSFAGTFASHSDIRIEWWYGVRT